MKRAQGKKDNRGFTLVEMIIVIAIIAMLIAMIAPNLTSFLDTASDTTTSANAKTAYTSINAWVTQQRVAGVALDDISADNALVIKLEDGKLVVEAEGASYTNQDNYAGIVNLFNAGEFHNDTEVHIWLTANYTVTKIEWVDGVESAVYPK